MRSRAVAFAAICFALPTAAAAAERHQFDLPAGRLGDAIAALGRQARVSVGVSEPALAAVRVPAVRGTMTVEQALQRLLRRTAARAIFIEPTVIRIMRRAPAPERPRTVPPSTPPPDSDPAERPPETIASLEITVTASRRAVPLRSYPGSVAIVGGDDPLLSGEVRGSEALVARLPAITSTHLGPGRNKLFLRGISDSSFNGPTQATVGQYLGDLRVNYSAPDPDLRLYDIDKVEVLLGPQGTLYGAGSLGGIVRILPSAPRLDQLDAHTSVGASVTAHGEPGAEAAAMVNVPLALNRSALRLSAYAVSEGGYIDDTLRNLGDVNRVRVFGGRATMRAMPDDHWTIDINAIGQRIRGEDAQFAERDQPPLTRRSVAPQDFGNDYLLTGLTGLREWDDYRFVSTTSFVRQEITERFDATRAGNPPAVYELGTGVSLFTGEVRLSRRSRDGGWILGATFVSNDASQTRTVDLIDHSYLRNRLTNGVIEGAIYGEGSMELARAVTATLGGRITGARVSSSGFVINPGSPLPEDPVRASQSRFRFLPTAAISAKPAPDLLVYGRYQQSFRPGGLAVTAQGVSRFRSDKIASVEFGARYGEPGRGAFDASAAVAHTRWNDVQADTLDLFAEPTTANIGNARLYSLDVSLGWRPLPGLSLEAAAVLNESELSDVPPGMVAEANPALPGVAAINGRLGAHYAFVGPLGALMRLTASARYTGRSTLGVGQFFSREQGDWLDGTAILRAEKDRHAFALSVTNLFDTAASRFALGSPFTLDQREFTTPVRPRTITFTWSLRR